MERIAQEPPASRRVIPASQASLRWAAAILIALSAGFAGLRYYSGHPAPTRGPETEDMRLTDHVDDLDFLHKLANSNDRDLFGDAVAGS